MSVRSDPFSPFKVSGCRFLLPQSLCVIDCSVERVILDSNSPLKKQVVICNSLFKESDLVPAYTNQKLLLLSMLMDNDELLLSRIQLVGVTFSDFMLLFLVGKWRVGFA